MIKIILKGYEHRVITIITITIKSNTFSSA